MHSLPLKLYPLGQIAELDITQFYPFQKDLEGQFIVV